MTFDLKSSQQNEWPSRPCDQALHYSPDTERGRKSTGALIMPIVINDQPRAYSNFHLNTAKGAGNDSKLLLKERTGLEPQGKQPPYFISYLFILYSFYFFISQEVEKHGQYNIPG